MIKQQPSRYYRSLSLKRWDSTINSPGCKKQSLLCGLQGPANIPNCAHVTAPLVHSCCKLRVRSDGYFCCCSWVLAQEHIKKKRKDFTIFYPFYHAVLHCKYTLWRLIKKYNSSYQTSYRLCFDSVSSQYFSTCSTRKKTQTGCVCYRLCCSSKVRLRTDWYFIALLYNAWARGKNIRTCIRKDRSTRYGFESLI